MKTTKLFITLGVLGLSLFVSVVAAHANEVNVIYVNGVQNTLPKAEATKERIRDMLVRSENHQGDKKKQFFTVVVWNPIGYYGTEDGPDLSQDKKETFLLKTAEEKFGQDFIKIMFPFNQCKTIDQEAATRVKAYLDDMTPGDNSLETGSSPVTDVNMRETQMAAKSIAWYVEAYGSAVVVAHSQGNLLANLAYAKLASDHGNEVSKMIRVVNIANTSEFSVNDLSLTHAGDAILFESATKPLMLDQSLETLPSRGFNWTRTTPICPGDGACDFIVAPPTFGRPTTEIPGQTLIDKLIDHSIVWTYLSTAIVPVAIDQGVQFTPGKERFVDRFEDLIYAASNFSCCGAYVAPGVWKEFDCYNLAAIGKETYADPFTPSWELIGGYWQWGRKGPDPEQQDWYNTNTPNFAHGPTGIDAADANSGTIINWDSTEAPDGAWSDSTKTANDPCPAGYRVPTVNQWSQVLANNTLSPVGTWADSATNYSSAWFFGDSLMLPAAGSRRFNSGALRFRGNDGSYWSSSVLIGYGVFDLYFSNTLAYVTPISLSLSRSGHSVRCVAE
jgi:hypothetical protein